MTFGLSNATGAASETFNIVPFFDQNQDGEVEASETGTYPIGMTLSAPPYNIYKVIPDNSGTSVKRHLMARNIDNLIIRYYDKNGDILPASADADDDGIYDSGAYTLAVTDMNNIRKVEVEVLARTKDEDPRGSITHSGTYAAGSAATLGGSSTYSDAYYRETFTAYMAPRNLVMAPWGKMDVVASPEDIDCPTSTSTITATLVDSQGVPVSAGISVDFALNGAGATASPTSVGTDIFGQASTTVTYDWSSPNASITVSASSLITSGGEQNPVFNAGTVNFQSGTGTFSDDFNGTIDAGWAELDSGADMFPADVDPADGTDDSFQMSATGLTRAVNGCQWQKYRVEFELTPTGGVDIDAPAVNPEAVVGGFLRFVDVNSNYSVVVEKQTSGNCVGTDGNGWCLKLAKWDGVSVTELSRIGIDFALDTKYKILAEVEDDNLRAKIWDTIGGTVIADPTPGTFDITATDPDYSQGSVGFLGDWTNGADVIFDNLSVSPIT